MGVLYKGIVTNNSSQQLLLIVFKQLWWRPDFSNLKCVCVWGEGGGDEAFRKFEKWAVNLQCFMGEGKSKITKTELPA